MLARFILASLVLLVSALAGCVPEELQRPLLFAVHNDIELRVGPLNSSLTEDISTEVVSTLLTEALGFKTVKVAFDYDTYDYPNGTFLQIVKGHFDIHVEAWLQDNPGKLKKYAHEESLVEYSSLGFIGSNGLFVSRTPGDEHPEFIFEHYLTYVRNENLAQFFEPDSAYVGSPEVCTEALGCVGGKWFSPACVLNATSLGTANPHSENCIPVLCDDLSFETWISQLAVHYNLTLTLIPYAETAPWLNALYDAVRYNKSIMAAIWEPHQATLGQGYFRRVSFPRYSPTCARKWDPSALYPPGAPKDAVDCDFESATLMKIYRADLVEICRVAKEFVDNYSLNIDDFSYLLRHHKDGGSLNGNLTTREVACSFINAFPQKVGDWIPKIDIPQCNLVDDSFYEIAENTPQLLPYDKATRQYIVHECFTHTEINFHTKILGVGLFASAAFLSLLSSGWFYFRRDRRYVKAASKRFSHFIFFSCAVLATDCIFSTRKTETWACIASEWVFHMALMSIFVTLAAKNSRLEKIFLQKVLKVVHISDVCLLKIIILGLVVEASSLGVADLWASYEVKRHVKDKVVYDACTRSNASVYLLPKLPIFSVILWILKLSFVLRESAPPEFREATQIEITVWLSFSFAILFEVLKGVFAGRPNIEASLTATETFLIVVIILVLYCVPRILGVCGDVQLPQPKEETSTSESETKPSKGGAIYGVSVVQSQSRKLPEEQQAEVDTIDEGAQTPADSPSAENA
ncbi:MAG: hypothetical protein MHM6MM_005411 [Cercozoa sp. M6MM]